jgi:hypothetical protein
MLPFLPLSWMRWNEWCGRTLPLLQVLRVRRRGADDPTMLPFLPHSHARQDADRPGGAERRMVSRPCAASALPFLPAFRIALSDVPAKKFGRQRA